MSITKKVVISIERAKVMHVVEGLSVTISQHNGGVPTFEQLWASESERQKLDIYYREAVGDLERRLMDWLTTTTSQYDLTATGADYTLTLMLSYWPSKLEGLLKNKVQDFLVHSITAGWLNDFEGLTVKNDYQAIAGQDLSDIQIIIFQRNFDFDTEERTGDSNKPKGEGGGSADARGTDTDKPKGEGGGSADERSTDNAETNTDGTGADAEERLSDRDEFKNGPIDMGGGASLRGRDDVRRVTRNGRNEVNSHCTGTVGRHRDNAPNRHHTDWTDWSGVGLPPMGYRQHDLDHYKAATESQHTGQVQETEQEDAERYMQEHVCGGEEHLCGHHDVNKLDW